MGGFPPANDSTQVRLGVNETWTPLRPEKVADDVAVKKMKRSLGEAIQQADKAC